MPPPGGARCPSSLATPGPTHPHVAVFDFHVMVVSSHVRVTVTFDWTLLSRSQLPTSTYKQKRARNGGLFSN